MKLSIANLRAAGLTADQIVRVLEDADADRREKERIKKRNQRSRPRDGGDSGDKRDTHIDTYLLPSLEEKKERKERKKVSIELADDWQPSHVNEVFARSKGWDSKRIASEGERFRDHAILKSRKFVSVRALDAAWRNWVTSPYQQNGGQNGKPARKSLADACDDLIARAESAERTLDLEPSEYSRGGEPRGQILDWPIPKPAPR